MSSSEYDVVVIGGGPAGSTTSTILAQHGLRVGLFEREKFPRFHIGESLIPETYWVLKRINMLPKMQRSHFVKKYSVQFMNANGKLSAPFYFWDNKPHECSQTWQVVRSEFDQMLLDNAREHGVDAYEGVHVVEVLFDGDRATGVRISENGERREVRAKVVVDASGQAALLQNRFKLRLWDPILNKGAIWTYFQGAYRDTGRDEGATMVVQTPTRKGWFWYIPQHDDIVSVGVVAPFDELFKGRGPHEQTFHEEVEACPGVKERIAKATAGHRLFRDAGLFVSVEGRRWQRMGAGRRRVRLPRSALLVRRVAGAEVGRAGRRRHRRGLGQGRRQRRAARQVGRRLQRRRRSHAPPRLRVLQRLQFRPLRQAVPRTAQHGHGPAHRRSVQRSRRQGVGADGIALREGPPVDPVLDARAPRPSRRATRPTSWCYPMGTAEPSGFSYNGPHMSAGFVYSRRVVFYETDLAGVVHFSNFFRYMEEAEHAFWRAAGMRIDGVDLDVGWPRVSATFDYKRPLHFEDEFRDCRSRQRGHAAHDSIRLSV